MILIILTNLIIVNAKYCQYSAYPCYYFNCNFTLNEIKVEKCPDGLIYNENAQKCGWLVSWEAKECHQNKSLNLNSIKNSLIKNLIKSDLKSPSIVEIMNSSHKPTQFSDLVYMNKISRMSYNNNNNDYDDNNNNDDEEQENDSYAYVIVPLKLPKKAKKMPRPKTSHTNEYADSLRYKKICYVTNWSQYRHSEGRFLPENIDAFLCTHIVYAFSYIDKVTLTLTTVEENDEEMYKRINNLKTINPKLKTLLGIGGWK